MRLVSERPLASLGHGGGVFEFRIGAMHHELVGECLRVDVPLAGIKAHEMSGGAKSLQRLLAREPMRCNLILQRLRQVRRWSG